MAHGAARVKLIRLKLIMGKRESLNSFAVLVGGIEEASKGDLG